MIYFAVINNGGFIDSFGTAEREIATVISKERYDEIKNKNGNHPTAPDGYQYRLRADNLEWELVELPPVEEPELSADEATAEDYEAALKELGVKL